MDLGSLIKDLGVSYIQTKYAQPRTTLPYQPALSIPGLGFDIEGDIPFVDLVKKPRRRRRRRLATLSDIRDLAALKSVLGGGQDLKTWIATHPT